MAKEHNKHTDLQYDQDGENVIHQQLTEAYQSGVVDSYITDQNLLTGEETDKDEE
ncbi:hypothetical protein [Scopulibacillus cellulosilyticus]|uniref:DUF4025 domain-containing protein n=1 Tax=Scopulibacillus cellulosilyticus TaxID=2665665 RepID=A0ABW2PY82_9BACL